jgi:hypothetical protein
MKTSTVLADELLQTYTRSSANNRKIWFVCTLKGIRLATEYIGSEGIIRSGADTLSRTIVSHGNRDDRSRLLPSLFKDLLEVTGLRPELDAFAETGGNQGGLPFYSREPLRTSDPSYLGYDALVHPWPRVTYAYPPLHLALVTVEKALRETLLGHTVLLVMPEWPKSIWYPLLTAYDSVDLGGDEKSKLPQLTTLPAGAKRPIESGPTWKATGLRAWIVKQK